MQAEMFLNLLFKALKEDIDVKRMAAFAKRLTQVFLIVTLYCAKGPSSSSLGQK